MFRRSIYFAPDNGPSGGTPAPQQTPQQTEPTQQQMQQAPAVDYEKIKTMLEGTLQAKEETALKAYFKQQGLSQQEMEQAITAFKQQKAASQPDVNAIQAQLTEAQQLAQQAQIDNVATLEAIKLGIDPKTVPYVLKIADLSNAITDGKVNEETVKNALSKVLEDVPAFKPQAAQANGFMQVGANINPTQTASDEALKKAFGL